MIILVIKMLEGLQSLCLIMCFITCVCSATEEEGDLLSLLETRLTHEFAALNSKLDFKVRKIRRELSIEKRARLRLEERLASVDIAGPPDADGTGTTDRLTNIEQQLVSERNAGREIEKELQTINATHYDIRTGLEELTVKVEGVTKQLNFKTNITREQEESQVGVIISQVGDIKTKVNELEINFLKSREFRSNVSEHFESQLALVFQQLGSMRVDLGTVNRTVNTLTKFGEQKQYNVSKEEIQVKAELMGKVKTLSKGLSIEKHSRVEMAGTVRKLDSQFKNATRRFTLVHEEIKELASDVAFCRALSAENVTLDGSCSTFSSHSCSDPNAVCANVTNRIGMCTCRTGYTELGSTCVAVLISVHVGGLCSSDATRPCLGNATCDGVTNKIGTCVCSHPYRKNGSTCTAVRHAFEVLQTKNTTYRNYTFLALQLKLPADGLSKSENWCRDYEYLCEDFNRRPTGCGLKWVNFVAFAHDNQTYVYRRCRDIYNSDMGIENVLSCNPSGRIADIANAAFPNLPKPARAHHNAFGFHTCSTKYCQKTIKGSEMSLHKVAEFWETGDTTVYTVCH